ncbi:MAG TPA: ParB/RepB/Spo0J family partition protein [Rhizobiaceae bacterium]|nr:ParB/RepB/Spo0J family partition protein [Rhizobiaceae bacterium]
MTEESKATLERQARHVAKLGMTSVENLEAVIARARELLEAGEIVPPPTRRTRMRIAPLQCDVYPLNGRTAVPFDPIANSSLIASIRDHGQQVPVIVRPGREAGRYELIAGTRRLNVVRYLSAFDNTVTLLAEVRDLTDQAAWTLAQAENADRKDISQLERARNWQLALGQLFEGNQSAFARALRVDKSVVSRMLALAALPEEIHALVARPETLNVHFAEQLAPALNDPQRRKELLALAANFTEVDKKLAPAELVRRLLMTPAEVEAFRPVPIKAGRHDRQAVWQKKPNGTSQLTIRPIPEELSKEDRRALFKDLAARIKEHLAGA